MALRLRGDANMAGLIKTFESLGDASVRAQLAQKMGATAIRLIRSSIDTSTDCYGSPMPMRVDDGAQPLQGLRNAFSATFDSDGLKVGTSKWYAKVHNAGWKIYPKSSPALRFQLPSGKWVSAHRVTIPKRQLVPMQATGGLGPIWGPAMKTVAAKFFRDYLRR